jgi:hypothetical protein
MSEVEPAKKNVKLAHFPPNMILVYEQGGMRGLLGVPSDVLDRATDQHNISKALRSGCSKRREPNFAESNLSDHRINECEIAPTISHCLQE